MRYLKSGGMHGRNFRQDIAPRSSGPAWVQAGFDSNFDYANCELGVRETLTELEVRFNTTVRFEIKPSGRGSWAYSEEGLITFGMNGLAYYAKNGYPEYPTLQYLLGLHHRRGEHPRKVHGYFANPYRAGRIVAGHEYAHILTDKLLGRRWSHQVPYQLVYARVLDYLFPGFGAVGRVYDRHNNKIDLRYWKIDRKISAKLDQEVTA